MSDIESPEQGNFDLGDLDLLYESNTDFDVLEMNVNWFDEDIVPGGSGDASTSSTAESGVQQMVRELQVPEMVDDGKRFKTVSENELNGKHGPDVKISGRKKDLIERLEFYATNRQRTEEEGELEDDFQISLPEPTLYRDTNADRKMSPADEMKVGVYLEHYEKQMDEAAKNLYRTDTYFFKDCSMVMISTTLKASVGQR
ncbi:hypothetical protein ScPMuIL_000880 [Solemya velum]